MDYSQQPRTPGWMVGLFIIFSLATGITFGLFVYHHAVKASYREQYVQLQTEIKELRQYEGKLTAEIPPLETQIQAKRLLATSLDASDKQTIEDVNRLVDTNKQHLKAISDAIEKEISTYLGLLKDAKDRRQELGQEEQRAMTNERDFDDKRAGLRMKIEGLSQEIEQVKKKGRQANADLDVRVAELEDRVRELTQQREVDAKELRSDGQIIQSQAADGFVVINRGHRENLRMGTRFSVFNRHGGKNIIKGIIEVTKVEEQVAIARVLSETDGNNPMIVNDQLANPVYDPMKIRGFAVRGDFTHFSKDELKRFILESGGRYDEDLTTNTDYLVAGDRCDPSLQQAIKLGISILSEEQLIESQLFRLPQTSGGK
jgi:NAD-dependent DNA ligase